MSTNVQYSTDPEPNGMIDAILCQDVFTAHKTVPQQLRLAYAWTKYYVALWLLGTYTFDQMMDRLGEIGDKLKADDPTRQIISNN